MKILGIDPGTATTGFGILECSNNSLKTIDCGWIETTNKDITGERLIQIFDGITAIIDKHNPDVLAIERLFFFINHKTAMAVAESIGVIKMAAERKKLKVIAFAPADIKLTVSGSGRADKTIMKASVRKILGIRSPKKKKTHFDDLADALAVAICYARKNMLVSGEESERVKVQKTKKK